MAKGNQKNKAMKSSRPARPKAYAEDVQTRAKQQKLFLNAVKNRNNWGSTVLVCGESHARRMDNKVISRLFGGSRVANIGIGGLRGEEMLTLMRENRQWMEKFTKVKEIVLSIGANNGFRARSAQENADIGRALLRIQEVLRGVFPNARIYVFRVIPSLAREERPKFEDINRHVRAFDANCRVVEIDGILSGIRKMFYADDVHLNNRGYQALYASLKSHLQ